MLLINHNERTPIEKLFRRRFRVVTRNLWQPQLNAAARRIGRGQIWGRPTDQPRADTPKLQVVLDAIYANDAAVCAPHLATDGMDLTVVRMLKYWLVVMLRNNFNS